MDAACVEAAALERVSVATCDPGARSAWDYLQGASAPGYHPGGHPFLSKLDEDRARAVIE